MKLSSMIVLAAGLLATAPSFAQSQKLDDRRLGVTHVEVNPSVKEASTHDGRANSLARVMEGIDGQLVHAFSETHKFEVVAYSDLTKVVDVGKLNHAVGSETTDFSYAGCHYSVQVTIDDFQDLQEKIELRALGETHLRRAIRLSGVVKLYDTTNAKLLMTASVGQQPLTGAEGSGPGDPQKETDAMLLAAVQQLCEASVTRVADVIFPMKVVAMSGGEVTLNRGDAFHYPPGMPFDVFALGEELVDPDTGKSLGREEKRVGQVRITGSTPDVTKAAVTEDHGIAKGQIVRPAALPPGGPGR